MKPQVRRIPDVLLERYLADSLNAAERIRLEASLADSLQDRARLEELRTDSRAFLIQHPPAPLVARFQEEQRQGRWWR
jgi:anti-sigma factor RsiW